MSKTLEFLSRNKEGKLNKVGHMEFKNEVNSQELYFYGDIVSDSWGKWCDEDKCPQDVLEVLNSIDEDKDLNIYINSGGGSVYAGLAIYNQLKRKKCNKIWFSCKYCFCNNVGWKYCYYSENRSNNDT